MEDRIGNRYSSLGEASSYRGNGTDKGIYEVLQRFLCTDLECCERVSSEEEEG